MKTVHVSVLLGCQLSVLHVTMFRSLSFYSFLIGVYILLSFCSIGSAKYVKGTLNDPLVRIYFRFSKLSIVLRPCVLKPRDADREDVKLNIIYGIY